MTSPAFDLTGKVALVTGGNAGIGLAMADALAEAKGRLAELSPATVDVLADILPGTWSGGNPVDIIGDAPGARYEAVLRVILEDAGVDAVLVINCPTAVIRREEAAQAVANVRVTVNVARSTALISNMIHSVNNVSAVPHV